MDFPRVLLTVLLSLSCSSYLLAQELANERIPYVIGASVSKGFNLFGRGHSPSLYALEQMGYDEDQVVKKTVITGSFRRKFNWLQESFAEQPPEIVFGIDLFHHDAKSKQEIPDSTFEYLNEMVELLCSQGAPVIVGTIWTREGNQEAADQLNAFLGEQAELRDNLYLFPTAEIMLGIKDRNRSYMYQVDGIEMEIDYKKGKKLLVDIAHPNADGARMMANILIEILNREIGEQTPYYEIGELVAELSGS